MSEGKKEQDSYETLADIEAEIGDKSDFCHNNVLSKDWNDWEQMHDWLLAIRRRIEAARRRKLNANSKSAKIEFCNAAAMREALKPFVSLGYWLIENAGKDALGEGISEMMPMLRKRIDAAESALAAPPRNCDVGTAEDQSERFKAFCHSHMYGFNDPRGYRCKEDCPVKMEICRSDKLCIYCQLVWAQMPYEAQEGGEE